MEYRIQTQSGGAIHDAANFPARIRCADRSDAFVWMEADRKSPSMPTRWDRSCYCYHAENLFTTSRIDIPLKTLQSANDLLHSVIKHELSGDRERVLELFEEASLYFRLTGLPQEGDWLNFCPGGRDGFYLVAGKSGYEVYYQERGYACLSYGRYADISDAAAAFFSAVAFIAPRDVSSKDLGPLPTAPLEEPTHAPLSFKSLILGLFCFAGFLVLASIVGVYIDKTFTQ